MKNPDVHVIGLVIARMRWFVLGALICCGSGLLSCQSSEAEKEFVLQFKNPSMAEGFDSLKVYGINEEGDDTLFIYAWKKGEVFQQEIEYPLGLKQKFTLWVRGYKNNGLNYESHSVIADGKSTLPTVSREIIAPQLDTSSIKLQPRIGSSVTLKPVWKTRPGVLQGGSISDTAAKFSPLGTFTWLKGKDVLSKDSVLSFDSVSFADSGTYAFVAENPAGRDSMVFKIAVKHLFPKIDSIPDQSLLEGTKFAMNSSIIHSDSLIYHWKKDSEVVSKDSSLVFSLVQKQNAGTYQLVVRNISDTTEIILSNKFRILISNKIGKWDHIAWGKDVWQ